MSALEKINIPQRDSPPPTWPLKEGAPKTVQVEQKPPKQKETTFIKTKTQLTKLPTQNDLPCCDGIPMETERHRKQMEILINSLEPWLGERGYERCRATRSSSIFRG